MHLDAALCIFCSADCTLKMFLQAKIKGEVNSYWLIADWRILSCSGIMKAASDALCIERKQELLCLYNQGGYTRTGFQSKVQWFNESVT
jgi:hypothetical protein